MDINQYQLREYADQIKIYGRHSLLSTGITCDFTASGIEFCICASGEVILSVQSDGQSFFTVWVDEVRQPTRFEVNEGQTNLVLAHFDTCGIHTVRVLKQNEPRHALCVFSSLTINGSLTSRPADTKHLIEFIGDSITCGYGNLCQKGTEHAGDAIYQDGTKAFAYLTAAELGVDHSMVSHSGIGVTKGYATFPMPTLYPKRCYLRDANKPFIPDRSPDLAVINLGTNDKSKSADTKQFINDVNSLIDTVRKLYTPDLPIVWVCCMMNDSYMQYTASVLQSKGGERAGLYLCEMEPTHEGGDSHPLVSAHEAASKRLAEFIKSKKLLP